MTSLRYSIALVLAAPFTTIAVAQPNPSTNEALIREAIKILSTQPLGRDRVDWKSLEHELLESIHKDKSPEAARTAIAKAVATLNDPHASYAPPPKPSPPAAPAQPATTSTTEPTKPAHPPIPTKPEGRTLDDNIAYLVVPGCQAPDVAGLRQYATAAAAELVRLSATNPQAWIIDLRLNGGGNVWPMLLGLNPLLGDGPHMTTIKDGKVQSRFGLSDGAAWLQWEGKPDHQTQLDWGPTPPTTVKPFTGRIAVLLGPWTMSSGESIAICFTGRDNTRTFGEKTAGLTTANNYFPLSDGSILNLPVSRMGDRRGTEFIGPIIPQQAATFGDWPTHDDPAVSAARQWLLR